MWKRCLALTLTLAILLLAAPAYALDPSTTLETAPTIYHNSTNTFSTPKYSTQRWYYKLELPRPGILTVSLMVYDRDTCPYFSVELRDRINKVQGAYKKMASANTGYQTIVNSSKGTPVPLFTAEVPAGSYFLSMFPSDNVPITLVCEFTCPHSNYSYTTKTEPATCDATGYISKVCDNCGWSYDTQTIARLPHTLARDGWTVTKEPTCTATGSETQTCSVCKKLQTQTLYKLGHDYGDWDVTTPASCAAPGEKARTCARCQRAETQALPQLDHTYGDWVSITAPTCTGSGKQMRVCTKCGNEETQFLSPTGHSYGDWALTTPPTCTALGVETKTCQNCLTATQTRPVDMVPHEYGDWVITTPPTCTIMGKETKTCLHCTDRMIRSVDAIDHTYGPWETIEVPTCSRQGTEGQTCTQCGNLETQPLPSLAHRYTCWELERAPTPGSDGLMISRCDYGCGYESRYTLPSFRNHYMYMASIGPRNLCWWGCSSEGRLSLIMLPDGYLFLAACYDDQGNFLEAKRIPLNGYTQLNGCLEKTRFFLLDENLVPQDVSQLIVDHPIPTT